MPVPDEVAIQQTLNRYTEAVGRRDWDQLLATFAPEGVWEVPAQGLRHTGHDAMREAMSAFLVNMAYFAQLNTPAVIEVSGDRATARSVIRECGKFADRDEALEVLGCYEDELVRTTEGWRFTLRRFQSYGAHCIALLPQARLR